MTVCTCSHMTACPCSTAPRPPAIHWIIGQHRGSVVAGEVWEFGGVFATREEAIAHCRDWSYFIAPVQVGLAVPHETTTWAGVEWPIAPDGTIPHAPAGVPCILLEWKDGDVCPRCGAVHGSTLPFRQFHQPMGRFTHWAPCPTNGEPILITAAVAETGAPSHVEP